MQGLGLGRHAYDEAERAVGLPLVPHQANMNVGMLGPKARRFWAKRIAAVGTPGFDPASSVRRSRAYRCAAPTLHPAATDDVGFAVAVAQALDLRVEWMTWKYASRVVAAWCLLPDGKVILPVGQVSREAASERFLGHGAVGYRRFSGSPSALASAAARAAASTFEQYGGWKEAFVAAQADRDRRSTRAAAWFLHDLDPGRWPEPETEAVDDVAETLAEEASAHRSASVAP